MINISVNGDRFNVEATTLKTLLLARSYKLDTAFACAINNTFVPRPQWSEHALKDGDKIDIVTPITGG